MSAGPASPQRTPRALAMPISPSSSSRSRELSWSSVYVTPYKVRQNGGYEVSAPQVTASARTQFSAKRYCAALLPATTAGACFWSLGSPAILIFLGDWRLLSIARLAMGVGAMLPPPSLGRSLRTYVRFALDVRVLLHTVAFPTLWFVLRSDLEPFSRFQHSISRGTMNVAFIAATISLLGIDAAAAAVPTAAGGPNAFRLEGQLLSEYSVCAPPNLLATLQRRLRIASEVGTLVLAPVLSGAALAAAAACGSVCSESAAIFGPALLGISVALLSLIAALVITSGGRPSRCEVQPGSSDRVISSLSLPEPQEELWASSGPVNASEITFTPPVRRTLNLGMPALPRSRSEEALDEAVLANVTALAAGRAEVAPPAARGRLFRSSPVLCLVARACAAWRIRGLLCRASLFATATLIEDAIVTVALPMLALQTALPATPHALLWVSACVTLSVAASRVGRLICTVVLARCRCCERHASSRRLSVGPAAVAPPPARGGACPGPVTPPLAPVSSHPDMRAHSVHGGRAMPPDHALPAGAIAAAKGQRRAGTLSSAPGLLAAASIAFAACCLPLASTLGDRLPSVLPLYVQRPLCLGLASLVAGMLLGAGCASLGSQLDSLCGRPCGALELSGSGEGGGGGGGGGGGDVGGGGSVRGGSGSRRDAAPPEWRELTEGVRIVGVAIVQPSLCVALGLLPLQRALWGAAAVSTAVCVLTAAGMLHANRIETLASHDSRHEHLIAGEGTGADAETPETVLLSSGQGSTSAGSAERSEISPAAMRADFS